MFEGSPKACILSLLFEFTRWERHDLCPASSTWLGNWIWADCQNSSTRKDLKRGKSIFLERTKGQSQGSWVQRGNPAWREETQLWGLLPGAMQGASGKLQHLSRTCSGLHVLLPGRFGWPGSSGGERCLWSVVNSLSPTNNYRMPHTGSPLKLTHNMCCCCHSLYFSLSLE